jgi:hypothetical protein
MSVAGVATERRIRQGETRKRRYAFDDEEIIEKKHTWVYILK